MTDVTIAAGEPPVGSRTPRRILMTTDAVGGVWDYTMELTRALAPAGIRFTVLVVGPAPSERQLRDAHAREHVDLIATDLRLEWQPGGHEDQPELNAMLRDLEGDLVPDLVHVNSYANAAAGFQAPVLLVAHSCVSTWWRACRGGDLPAEWARYVEGVQQGLAAADRIVAPTQSHLDALQAVHGPQRHAEVIHNGRDANDFRPAAKEPYVLAAGRRWDEAKNIGALCAVADGIPAPVRIAGEGDLTEAPGNVAALGRLDTEALAAEMGRAAIFASPARYEPFGLAVLEAALSGCALVLSDIPTFRELWEGAARFVDPGDPQALAREIRDCLEEPASAMRLGEAARSRAAVYSASRMGESYLALYRDLVDERTRAEAAAA